MRTLTVLLISCEESESVPELDKEIEVEEVADDVSSSDLAKILLLSMAASARWGCTSAIPRQRWSYT